MPVGHADAVIRPLRADDVPAALALLDEASARLDRPGQTCGPRRAAPPRRGRGRRAASWGLAGCAVGPSARCSPSSRPTAGRALARFAARRPRGGPGCARARRSPPSRPRYRGRGLYAAMLAARLEWGAAAGAGIAAGPRLGARPTGATSRARCGGPASRASPRCRGPVRGASSGACPYCGRALPLRCGPLRPAAQPARRSSRSRRRRPMSVLASRTSSMAAAQVGERPRDHLDGLVLVGGGPRHRCQARREEAVDELGEDGGGACRSRRGRASPTAARPTSSAELAAGALERVLAGVVELAGRQLERVLLDRLARLAHEQHVVVLDRHDHHGARVVDDLARHHRPVRAPVVGAAQVDDGARVDRGSSRWAGPSRPGLPAHAGAGRVDQPEGDVEHRLEAREGDALVGRVDVEHARCTGSRPGSRCG